MNMNLTTYYGQSLGFYQQSHARIDQHILVV